MRILANENFPQDAIVALRLAGYDVLWVRESMPGSQDEQVLAHAQKENRVLITFDKDFGELAFRSNMPSENGIILFRIPMKSPEYVAELTLAAIVSRSDWIGHFSVVDETRIRMTPLPIKKSS